MKRFATLVSQGFWLGLTIGCSAPKGNVASVSCAPKGAPAATLNGNPLGLAETGAGGVTGMQTLHGYFDVDVSTDGTVQQIRCMMNLLPEVNSVRLVKVATAGHCLPTLSKTTGNVVKLKVQVFYKNGFIPLSIEAFNIDKVLNSGAFLNQYVVPLVSNAAQLGIWLPENGTSNCKRCTETFKLGGASNHKTACFSRQDLRIIDAKISELDEKWLDLYDQALIEFNRVKGAALSELVPEMSRGMQALRKAHNVNDARKRNLRAIAYLANVQYCTAGVETVNPADNQPDTKTFCQLRQLQPAMLEQFFKLSTTDQEHAQMQGS